MEGKQGTGQISVIGAATCSPEISAIAHEVGEAIAAHGFTLVCGGLGGVMEAACRGAKEAGGITIGIIPTDKKEDANPYVDIVIPTGLGHARNVLIVHAADALVAVAGEAGTLSEIALALKTRKPIVGIQTWDVRGRIPMATGGREAVTMALEMLR
jgi:uncharacterized protein (TIGR00725 family)